MKRKKVIIVGAGFGGLRAAQMLKKSDVDLLVIDKTNHHLFQPLLYQVATAALSPADVAMPIRDILRKQSNTEVIMGEVVGIDPVLKQLEMRNGDRYCYDHLILATGSSHSYFRHPEWQTHAPGLKTLADAIEIRERILIAFEKAERCDNRQEAQKYLRFVIIGGGPTGVELAGAIAEISRQTMFQNFRKIHPEEAEIFLIEGGRQILATYPEALALKAQRSLEGLGVSVLTNTLVTEVVAEGVRAGNHFFESSNIIWAAGNEVSFLYKSLNVPLDRIGRVIVNPDLSVPGYPDVFVIGDAAHVKDKRGNPLAAIAPVAIQEGEYVGKLLSGRKKKPFKYRDKGQMATIGKAHAIAKIGPIELSGVVAWLMWSLIHMVYLINFRSKIAVMSEWFFLYLTGRRNARLIIPR